MNERTVPEPSNRRRITIDNGGANTGARRGMSAFTDWNRDSSRFALAIRYVDPVPGRAMALAREANLQGIEAEGIEGRIEDVIRQPSTDEAPILLNLDRASAIAEILRVTATTKRVTLAHLLLKLPSGELWGIRLVIQAGESELRAAAVRFFDRLAELTARRGSGAILGAGGASEDLATESVYRAWFARHTHENLGHIVAGTEPDANPIEVTDDGVTTYPLFVHEAPSWSDPRALARDFGANAPVPILRGESFAIAEITPEGIRFHKVRRRRTDGAVSVVGGGAMDVTSLDAEERERRTAEALVLANRQTLSRSSPVLTTD